MSELRFTVGRHALIPGTVVTVDEATGTLVPIDTPPDIRIDQAFDPSVRGEVDAILAGGVHVAGATIPTSTGPLPAVMFAFRGVAGAALSPLAYVPERESDLALLPDLVATAIAAARREARR